MWQEWVDTLTRQKLRKRGYLVQREPRFLLRMYPVTGDRFVSFFPNTYVVVRIRFIAPAPLGPIAPEFTTSVDSGKAIPLLGVPLTSTQEPFHISLSH